MGNYRKYEAPKRGEIYYISNGKCYATDPRNEAGRPAVIVSSDHLNETADYVEVVYLTSQSKKPMNTHAEVICKMKSTALCETIYTVRKDRIGDYVRTCTAMEIEEINAALLNSLGIDFDDEEECEESTTPVCDVPVVEPTYPEDELQVALTERNVYKSLYEQLLNKVVSA